MDSTVLLPCKDINEFINPSWKFWSCHHLPIYHNISKGGWTGFFLACGKGNPLSLQTPEGKKTFYGHIIETYLKS